MQILIATLSLLLLSLGATLTRAHAFLDHASPRSWLDNRRSTARSIADVYAKSGRRFQHYPGDGA